MLGQLAQERPLRGGPWRHGCRALPLRAVLLWRTPRVGDVAVLWPLPPHSSAGASQRVGQHSLSLGSAGPGSQPWMPNLECLQGTLS